MEPISIETARAQFPLFTGASAPAYLDTAASSQKPRQVIDRLANYLSFEHANIHRGVYRLSAEATAAYDQARIRVAGFFGAGNPDQIIFTRGTTESINLAAYSLENEFREGDTILLTILEHHSNIVPWQLLAKRKRLNIAFVDCTDQGAIDPATFAAALREHRPKLVAFTCLSNALGSVLPAAEFISAARGTGAWTLLDGAQAAAHLPIDLQALEPDLFACSGHKLYGPTGIGVLYASSRALERMEPFHGGGDMIESVTTEGATFAPPPRRFEAGTPAIAEAIALGTAVEFIQAIGLEAIAKHEHRLFERAVELLSSEAGVVLHGPHKARLPQLGSLSFTMPGIHPHDIASVADSLNVQIRGGHHCCMPLMHRLGLGSTARASFGVYTVEGDLLALRESVRKAKRLFG